MDVSLPAVPIQTRPAESARSDRAIKELSASTVRKVAGDERENPAVNNLVAETDSYESTNVEKQIEARRSTEAKSAEDAKRTNQLNSLHLSANSEAKGLLLSLALNSDPTLLKKYLEKGADKNDSKSLETARAENLSTVLKNPEVIDHVASQMVQRRQEGEYEDEDGNKVTLNEEQQELYSGVLEALTHNKQGSHAKTIELIQSKEGRNFPPELLSKYQEDLSKISELTEQTAKPSNTIVEPLGGDKRERAFIQKLLSGAQELDKRGGIYNFRDDQVTWSLATLSRENSSLNLRLLAPSGNTKGNSGKQDRSRTFGDFLTLGQPMPYTNTVA